MFIFKCPYLLSSEDSCVIYFKISLSLTTLSVSRFEMKEGLFWQKHNIALANKHYENTELCKPLFKIKSNYYSNSSTTNRNLPTEN